MKKEDLFSAIGDVDEMKVKQAGMAMQKKKSPIWIKWGAIAACLAVLLSIGVVQFQKNAKDATQGEGIKTETVIEYLVKIESWQSEGFVGTITDNGGDNEKFPNGDKVFIVFQDNTTAIQQDGSVFDYDFEEPNANKCDLPIGSIVKVGFQAYEYTEGYSHNRISAYHISPYNSTKFDLPSSDAPDYQK